MPRIVQKTLNRLGRAWRKLAGEPTLRGPLEYGGFVVRCQQDFPADPQFLAKWDALASSTPTSTAFARPAWQKAVWETLGKPGRLRLLSVTRGEELVAVLPMSLRDDFLLESLGPSVSDYLDPLIAPAHETEAWRVILKALAAMRRRDQRVTLHCVRGSAPCRALLPSLAPSEGFEYAEEASDPTPVLALPPTWDDYLATLDAHERKETRRKINKVMTKGAGRAVRCSADPAEIARTLPIALSLMEQAPGEKGEAIRKTVRPLLEKAGPPMIAAGHLWLTTLYLGETAAAITIQFPRQGGPLLYNCGFDAVQKEFSPGVVLTSLTIQQAIETGAKEYDLLRGQEPYKYKLGAKDRQCYRLTLHKV